jgi:hypothetical protein
VALLACAIIVFACLLLAACGGGSDAASFPTVLSLGDCDVCPQIRNTSLGVGANRVLLGLTDRDSKPVLDAQVHLRFYDLNESKPIFKSETDTTFEPVQLSYVNESAGGATTPTGDDGVYVANARFERSGTWGVQVEVTRGGKKLKDIPFTFSVLEKTPEPAIGDAAPASEQITTANVSDIHQIDSSSPARPAMHDMTVAAALATGKPVVVAFATPAFCTSRLCAPIMDTVMDPLSKAYGGQAVFIHIEPYDLTALRDTGQQIPVPATRQWGLQSEPWIFVIDREGKVAGKYEGIATEDEVARTLQRVIAEPAAGAPAGGATGAASPAAATPAS